MKLGERFVKEVGFKPREREQSGETKEEGEIDEEIGELEIEELRLTKR